MKNSVIPSFARRVTRALAPALAAASLAFLAVACETYDAPPRVFVVDLVDGNLPDPKAPIVLEFSEPVDPATLAVKVAFLETDAEGNLFDEDEPKDTELAVLFDSTKKDTGGVGELAEDRLSYTIDLTEELPVGPAMVVLVEPGLADAEGTAWEARQRIPFGFKFSCQEGATSEIFLPGAYFLLVDVEKPLPLQLQLWAWFDVDPETGIVTGQFTNADRIKGGSCGCGANDACQTVPTTECVTPSEKASTVESFVDFVANDEPPEGYTFRANGCVADQGNGTVSFGNAPVDVKIGQPDVTVVGTQLTAQFTPDADGVLRCSGSFVASLVLIGTVESGPASGTFTGRSVVEAELPAEIPKP